MCYVRCTIFAFETHTHTHTHKQNEHRYEHIHQKKLDFMVCVDDKNHTVEYVKVDSSRVDLRNVEIVRLSSSAETIFFCFSFNPKKIETHTHTHTQIQYEHPFRKHYIKRDQTSERYVVVLAVGSVHRIVVF